ncbi:hypothetical protein B9Z55_019456 [Caenorhabditis nigoni]|uniref:Glycosyltransferase family 92 protein n=1 Tax=Caenorhabditis nigoni TaxID=1611254 RepID=A0A2G5TJA8_9PELO|nr:hypothetical protein B9Z55_019456 [Caenorhabditis nigoni]
MKTTLILLLFTFTNSERLEEIRKSCATSKTVYVLNDDYWMTEPKELRNPGVNETDWEKLVNLTCEYKPLSSIMRLNKYNRSGFKNETKRYSDNNNNNNEFPIKISVCMIY